MMYGSRLKLRRKAKGLSQRELGELVGCSYKTISNYEAMNEEPDTNVAYAITHFLGEF